MAKTYLELKAEAEKLLKQAEEMRQQEIAEIISEIKSKMAQYGITAADLGSTRRASKKAAGAAPVVKYRSPNGDGWSGMGRQPQWMKDALEQGKSKEDFAV